MLFLSLMAYWLVDIQCDWKRDDMLWVPSTKSHCGWAGPMYVQYNKVQQSRLGYDDDDELLLIHSEILLIWIEMYDKTYLATE